MIAVQSALLWPSALCFRYRMDEQTYPYYKGKVKKVKVKSADQSILIKSGLRPDFYFFHFAFYLYFAFYLFTFTLYIVRAC